MKLAIQSCGALALALIIGACGDPEDGGSTDLSFDYEDETVTLSDSMTIAEGETVRVGPGTTFVAGAGMTIRVEGSLIVEGTRDARVDFTGGPRPQSWEGIVIAPGGYLELTHAHIGGANYAIYAEPGSDFVVDYTEIDTSFKAAVILSDGSFDHTLFHANGGGTPSVSSAEPITNVNGTLTIVNASPMISNSVFDNSTAYIDMIRVRDDSSPIFDHVRITEAHCGLHTETTPNSEPSYTNMVFDGLAYAIMAYRSKPTVSDSVFTNNDTDVGICDGAAEDNAPQLENNFYDGGGVRLDAGCTMIGTTDTSPASVANPTAGPEGL